MNTLQDNSAEKDVSEDSRTLHEIAEAMTEEAKRNGLTDEQLSQLLED